MINSSRHKALTTKQKNTVTDHETWKWKTIMLIAVVVNADHDYYIRRRMKKSNPETERAKL